MTIQGNRSEVESRNSREKNVIYHNSIMSLIGMDTLKRF